jgi:IrrE N-terminal-like domain
MSIELTASKAAYKFTHVLDLFAEHHGTPRFPVDVVSLAKDAANQFRWNDPITEVRAEDINHFEGALIPGEGKREWLLLYNEKMKSEGRIRFTQAHELGHYLLHRHSQEAFTCAEKDVINLETNEATIEAQADVFASTLLMPLNDFRAQMCGSTDFDGISACASRYGVSLTAAALRWLKHTEQRAVLVVHRDGFMNWAFSSEGAAKSGAFFRTRSQIIAIPKLSLAADESVLHERTGVEMAARTWFPHAHADMSLREMKITANEYDSVMTLLVLPRGASVWEPWEEGER